MAVPSHNWVEIHGVVVEGYGVASGTATDSPYPRGSIEMQAPVFRDLGVDLTNFHMGTLNVSVAPLWVSLHQPSYTFRSVRWSPDHEPEDFSFSPCRVVYRGRQHDGFIYLPHEETKLGHHHDSSILEIITHHLAEIGYGDRLDLLIDPAECTVRSVSR